MKFLGAIRRRFVLMFFITGLLNVVTAIHAPLWAAEVGARSLLSGGLFP